MTTSRLVDSGMARLAVETVGTGVPVVLLHAGVADRRMWSGQMAALARAPQGFRAIAYDRRGFGDTLHADESYSQVRDLIAVLEACAPGERAIVVGCSQGGRIAIDAALEHPGRVRALLLVAPAIGGAPQPESFPPAIQAWIDRAEAAEEANDTDLLNRLEAHAWLDGPASREGRVSGTPRGLFLAMNEIALRAEQRGSEREPPSAYERLEAIAAPTLVVWGDLDFPHLAERCRELASRIRGAQAQVMEGTAHLPNLEQPEAFNRILLAFCGGLSR